jgi:hypothetical protein
VAFGEVYAAWSEQGLAFGIICQDYHDIDLFDYPGEFPLGDAFRWEIGVDAGHGSRWWTVYFIPPSAMERAQHKEDYRMRPLLLEGPASWRAGVANAIEAGSKANYFGSDQPRISADLTLSWSAVGAQHAPPTGRIKLEIAVTAWHQSRWMSLSGLDSNGGVLNPAAWETVELVGAATDASGGPADTRELPDD